MTAVFSIAPGLSFVDTLAEGIIERVGDDPLALSRVTVLLPTNRACRALREAFLRHTGGKPLLLPRLRPLGELDEDELSLRDEGESDLSLPPAIPPLRRQLLLARLIMADPGRRPTPEQAAQLAAELGGLLDQVQIEGLSFDRLARLVPEEYARHWQITVEFLKLLTHAWPGIVAEAGFMDAAERRRRLLLEQAAQWRDAPPDAPVFAAGSTGSQPATAALLAVVADLPRGCVVLPGLDRDMDDESWAALEPTHPQYGMKALLQRLDRDRRQVRLWQRRPSPRPARLRLINEALRPAATTEAWRLLDDVDRAALDGVRRLDCPGPRDEAGAVALLLREALETDGRTAALVTPDRALARRVAGELGRWGIQIDDSGGKPLGLAPPGVFLRLVADSAAEPADPHALLALLKHPLAAGGMAGGGFRARVRRLERCALRGPRPAAGALRQAAADGAKRKHLPWDRESDGWLRDLQDLLRPFAELLALPSVPLPELVQAHIACAEALAADDERPGAARLWLGEAGEAAAGFVSELREAADAMGEIRGAAYAGLFETLMGGAVVRPRWGGHPRIHVLGPLEARLQRFDLVILGGLNEGTWPPMTGADPWMSRPMRQDFGLPLPERRIGLSAHDFAQAFCAPEVVLTRALRVDGTPTVPSRWLMRLDAVLAACALPAPAGGPHPAWFLRLDQPDALIRPSAPAPRPPVSARPRQLSATQIETWMRDPYAIYARHILKLKALEAIDEAADAAQYGEIIHAALEAFLKAHPQDLPADAESVLLAIGRAVFGESLATPGVWAFWWPRFESIARWFAAQDRSAIERSHCEVQGSLPIEGPAGTFTLTAKADRIDLLKDGTLAVIDYKTGSPPSSREVAAGYAPQLPIEAAIARNGRFPEVPAKPVARLDYWRLRGGDIGGEISSGIAKDLDAETLAAEALAGVRRLVEVFDREETTYQARPHPDRAPRFSDYTHLARVKEWASTGGEEE